MAHERRTDPCHLAMMRVRRSVNVSRFHLAMASIVRA